MLRVSTLARTALAVVLVSGQVMAQPRPPAAKPPPPTAAELQEARSESELGTRLSNLGVFETAVTHFQRAYDLAHKPADLKGVADSYKALGQGGLAYDAYTRLLAQHGPALGFAGVVAVKKAIAELEAGTGTIDVHSTPDGAQVRVNGRAIGVTPFAAPVRLPAGAVRVEVSKDGFDSYDTNVAIDPTHPSKVEAQLAAHVSTGHLAVTESHGSKAHLLLDGQDVGALPWEGDVPPGVHQLALKSVELTAAPQTIKVARASKVTASFTADFTKGTVAITAHPDSAIILVDGQQMGTGKYEGQIALGDHVLHVTATGYEPLDKTVTVSPDKPVTAEVNLVRIITADEIAAAQAERDADAIRGGYGQLTVFGAWPPLSTHLTCDQVSQPTGGNTDTCSPGFVYGGGAALRAGYSWGVLGLELVGAFLYTRQEDDVAYANGNVMTSTPANPSLGAYQHSEAYTFTSMGGMIGGGPRLMTPGRHFRLTLGAEGGMSIRQITLDRKLSSGVSESSPYSSNVTAISPAVLGDLGFIIGSTPGVNFVIGAMAWAEFPSSTVVSAQNVQETPSGGKSFNQPSGPYKVLDGPQVFIGPYLGIRFGH